MATDAEDERAVLEVVEFSESEDEDFEYKAVEVQVELVGGRGMTAQLFSLIVIGSRPRVRRVYTHWRFALDEVFIRETPDGICLHLLLMLRLIYSLFVNIKEDFPEEGDGEDEDLSAALASFRMQQEGRVKEGGEKASSGGETPGNTQSDGTIITQVVTLERGGRCPSYPIMIRSVGTAIAEPAG